MTSARSPRRPQRSRRARVFSSLMASRRPRMASTSIPSPSSVAVAARSEIASQLPPVAIIRSGAQSRSHGASCSERSMYSRSSARRAGVTGSSASRKASCSRTVPMGSDTDMCGAPLASRVSSTLPPPMSTSSARRSPTGTALCTAMSTSRASSTPSMTSSLMPASRCARSTSRSALWASRTALVATAR